MRRELRRMRRVLTVGLFAGALALPCKAGDVRFPSSVQADVRGDYRVVIEVSNTTDPMFQILRRDNVADRSISVVRTGPTTFRIEIEGRLINLRRNGSFTFQADPEGELRIGEVEVLAPFVGVRVVEHKLIVANELLKAGITCEFSCSDGSSWTLFCGAHDTPEECCRVVREHGCPEGSKLVKGECDGTDCGK